MNGHDFEKNENNIESWKRVRDWREREQIEEHKEEE